MADTELPAGLYDHPVTASLAAQLAGLPEALRSLAALDAHEAPHALARLLHRRLVHALGSLTGEDRVGKQLAVANAILELLAERAPRGGADPGDHLVPPGQRLLAVLRPAEGLGTPTAPIRPEIPLSSSDLLVNGRHSLSIGPEVRRELASADSVDLLCSFLKWSGVRVLLDALKALLERRPGGLRILTTAYMNATQRRALDALEALGATIKVSYDTDRTRLHAKAWLFHRETGLSTGFIGSSNLSAAALLDGLEWNVRLSQVDNGPILDKFRATFEQYWDHAEFHPYDPEDFDKAIKRQTDKRTQYIFRFDIEPKPHQREILDHLAAERRRGHTKNLVVAATGTGKTVVAALDYKRLRAELPRARLLFVAHRREILEQSQTTFQVVLGDGTFGELLVGDERPVRGEHVFASVQSLRPERLAQLPPDTYDVVIVDEFHHAAAPTYERLLAHLRPRVLLGLTATPERADGRSILGWFDDRVASELRLWKALDQELLSPFQYFGVGGAPDLRGVRWSRGRYDVAHLGNVYTADHLFAVRVFQEVVDKVSDPSGFRALGFCVDIAHAELMARLFTDRGVAARAVSGRSRARERREVLDQLRRGEIRVVFSVDLLNEGVDVPDVDTVIFLRPTESATVFLQQLGRGLRRVADKECLTVLDFIGDAHRKFRFDARFRAILGGTRRGIQREIARGFPSLPSGCTIQLDRQAQRAVLDNIEHALGLGYRGLVEDLRGLATAGHEDIGLAEFLRRTEVDLEDVYGRPGRSWTRLRYEAGLAAAIDGPDAQRIERGLSRMLHLDDDHRLAAIRAFVDQPEAPPGDASDPIQRMLFVMLGYPREPLATMGAAWRSLWANPGLRAELVELVDVLADRVRLDSQPLPRHLAASPLRTHATYTLDEVMAAFDERTAKGGIKRIQTGVYYLREWKTDLLFVTLEKLEHHYTPTTMYNDYPLSPTRFHWESQSNCHAGTPTGRRYVGTTPLSAHTVLLFVRARRKDERGVTLPYRLLGPCTYHSHRGARPMQIEWDLRVPMPAGLYQEAKVAAG